MSDLDKILEERANIARQRAALEKRDAELAIAEKVLRELSGRLDSMVEGVAVRLEALGYPMTRREKVLEVLGGERVWMTSGEINAAILEKYGETIKGSSFFPMLTSLKNEGVVVRKDNKLALAKRITGGNEVKD